MSIFTNVYSISVQLCLSQWRHNGRDSVSNHKPHDCLLNRLFRHRSKKTSKLHVTGLPRGAVNSLFKWPVTRNMFPFDDVIRWCHIFVLGRCDTLNPNGPGYIWLVLKHIDLELIIWNQYLIICVIWYWLNLITASPDESALMCVPDNLSDNYWTLDQANSLVPSGRKSLSKSMTAKWCNATLDGVTRPQWFRDGLHGYEICVAMVLIVMV